MEIRMNGVHYNRIIVGLSLPLAALVIIASSAGLLLPETYVKETPNWTAQAIGQDLANLLIVIPSLIVTSLLARRGSTKAGLLWGGTILYLVYTFVIYCFAVHFNRFFIVYCFTLGLAFYSLLYFLYSQTNSSAASWLGERTPVKTSAIYLIVVGCLFYVLWLSELLPATVSNATPKILIETGLPVNPVHALDLSVLLPGFIITAIMLLKKHALGVIMTPVFLFFAILMNITIGGLIVVMGMRGLEADYSVTVIMGVLTLISASLLVVYLRSLRFG